jgi:hypothetical protein
MAPEIAHRQTPTEITSQTPSIQTKNLEGLPMLPSSCTVYSDRHPPLFTYIVTYPHLGYAGDKKPKWEDCNGRTMGCRSPQIEGGLQNRLMNFPDYLERRWFLGSDDGFEQKTRPDGHVLVIHHGLWLHQYLFQSVFLPKFTWSSPDLNFSKRLTDELCSQHNTLALIIL